MDQPTLLTFVLLSLSAAISLGLGIVIWQRYKNRPAQLSLVLSLALAIWSMAYAFELSAADLNSKTFWAQIQYIGIAVIPVAWFLFAQIYSGRSAWSDAYRILALSIIPGLTVFFAFSNQVHGLVWSQISLNTTGPFRSFDASYGTWWWVFYVYACTLMLLGSLVLFRTLRSQARLFRRQFLILLLAPVLPWLSSTLYIFRLSPVPQLDLGPFVFTISLLLIAVGVYQFQLFDLIPVGGYAAVQKSQNPAMMLDMQGRIVHINPAASRLLNGGGQDLVGGMADELVPWWREADEGYWTRREIQLDRNSDGQQDESFYHLQITPIWDSHHHITGRMVILEDISAQKMAEAALSMAQVKSEFLAKVGHELRTPLTSILAVADMFERGYYGRISDHQKEAIRLISKSTHKMERLVSDLLEQSRLERKSFRLDLAEFSVDDLGKQIRADAANQAAEKGLEFHLHVSPDLPKNQLGDAVRLNQILDNLVQNAIKYTDQGEVVVAIMLEDDQHWSMQVSDTGIGISPDLLPLIFSPFRQGGRGTQRGGLGLGLSIVKQLVSMMDGEVRVDSELGRGSVFTVVLPLQLHVEVP